MSGGWPRLLLFGALMLNVSSLKSAPAPSAAIQVPPSDAEKWVLPDGLTVIVKEDHSAPVASVQVWCATGSINEDERLGAGMSHILEHMLFKGTKTQSNSAIAQKVQ